MTVSNIVGASVFVVIAVLSATPAAAQTDLAGNWAPRAHEDLQDRGIGPNAVDFLGLPINEAARTRALSYTSSALSLPERQCLYYPPQYVVLGPQGFKIWSESDPVTGKIVAWKISAAIDRTVLTIWMDDRPRPSAAAPHPFEGFTTGVWEGNTLKTYTTHIGEGPLRRNGVPSSDQTTITEYISRYGDVLTIVGVIEDPVYLSEPHVVSRSWQVDPNADLTTVPDPCVPAAEVPRLDGTGIVPHYLPGQNPYVNEMTKMHNIPVEAVMGGVETMYPEYRKRLKGTYVRPEKCVRYCCPLPGCIVGGSPQNPSVAF